ncbi:MAG: 30S ribosomal protein S12 methylthiotransferase RimO [Planctomycetes bacterium]|nr:30S ribosomal protein S12 methylthiotransferase RimO [Planctomycetota bacterium]
MELLPVVENGPDATATFVSGPRHPKGTYAFVSLGCPKNLVDSEKMLGHLALDGYSLVSSPDGADFVIVNTCGFIDSSRQESKGVIREMLDLKRAGRTGGVIVAGCLPERIDGGQREAGGKSAPALPGLSVLPVAEEPPRPATRSRLLQEFPDIDHIVGVFGRDEITRVADRLVGGAREQRELFRPAPITALDDRSRLRITPAHYAYLKISEGCDRTCTFCAIPMMRGRHITKPIEAVVAEARELAADGVRELILVAQDTTYYGLDLYGEVRLVQLLKELEAVEGLKWIRLMYLYPVHFTDELIDTIAGSERIIPYLDMPLQHISDRVLKRMQRRVNRRQTIELVEKLRARIPNVVLRTTFITGFPGETDAEFAELAGFVREARFERMGVFTYSLEPGTPAEKLDGHLPEDVKQARRDELMALQQQIAFEFADSLVDYELDVLVDEPLEEGLWLGRTYADAPEIDASVYIYGEGLEPGQFVPVELIERREYDWVGSPCCEVDDGRNGN